MSRRQHTWLPRQHVVVTDILQWDRTLFQHPLNASILLRITHVRHRDIETDVLCAEVFAHAPPAWLRVWTVDAPTITTHTHLRPVNSSQVILDIILAPILQNHQTEHSSLNILPVCFASCDVIALKTLPFQISMHMLYHIMKGIYWSVCCK